MEHIKKSAIFIVMVLILFGFSNCTTEECGPEFSFNGFWAVTMVTESFCNGELCDTYNVPGEIDGCMVDLEGSYMSFSSGDDFSGEPGYSAVELFYHWQCPEAEWMDTRTITGNYVWFEADNILLLNYFEDAAGQFEVDSLEDKVILYQEEQMLWGIYSLKIELEKRQCSGEMGRCYSRTNCSGGPLLGCCSMNACKTALEVAGIKGSWKPSGGKRCTNLP